MPVAPQPPRWAQRCWGALRGARGHGPARPAQGSGRQARRAVGTGLATRAARPSCCPVRSGLPTYAVQRDDGAGPGHRYGFSGAAGPLYAGIAPELLERWDPAWVAVVLDSTWSLVMTTAALFAHAVAAFQRAHRTRRHWFPA